MAVYVYGLSSSDLVVPGEDTSEITASTTPLTTTILDGFIEDGSAILNGLYIGRGYTAPASDMEENAHRTLRAAVMAYAVRETLRVVERADGADYDRADATYTAKYEELSATPGNLPTDNRPSVTLPQSSQAAPTALTGPTGLDWRKSIKF